MGLGVHAGAESEWRLFEALVGADFEAQAVPVHSGHGNIGTDDIDGHAIRRLQYLYILHIQYITQLRL